MLAHHTLRVVGIDQDDYRFFLAGLPLSSLRKVDSSSRRGIDRCADDPSCRGIDGESTVCWDDRGRRQRRKPESPRGKRGRGRSARSRHLDATDRALSDCPRLGDTASPTGGPPSTEVGTYGNFGKGTGGRPLKISRNERSTSSCSAPLSASRWSESVRLCGPPFMSEVVPPASWTSRAPAA